MNVKFVINKCIDALDVEYTKDELLNCFNLVENQMAMDYFPLYKTHQCDSKTVYYSEFEYNPIRIISCNCKFKVHEEYIESKDIINEIIYSYAPNKKDFSDECTYNIEFLDCYVYGIISEFLLRHMFYDEASYWNEKYKKEIKLLSI